MNPPAGANVEPMGDSAIPYTWWMEIESEPYGGQLLTEIRKLRCLDLVTSKLDYQAIQVLKQADRQATLKLFYGSSYEFLQLIKDQGTGRGSPGPRAGAGGRTGGCKPHDRRDSDSVKDIAGKHPDHG